MEWLLAIVAVVGVVVGAAWLGQDKLIFFPQPLADVPATAGTTRAIEIVAPDGVRLRGWIRPALSTPAPTILYFGGNAEEVSWTVAERWPRTVNVVAVNYRGYGASEGKPGERALVADAAVLYDTIRRRPDVDPNRMVVVGRSLGTGVAVQLAAARPVAGVVLASPYDSLVAVGRTHYPLLPVGLLLRHRFDVLPLARSLDVPMLCLVASDDSIIPVARSRTLFDAWRGPKRWVAVDRTDHNTLAAPDAFWREIEGFLSGLASGPRSS